MSKWQWILKQFSKKLWVRAGLFCILGVLTAMVAYWTRDLIPPDIAEKFGTDAADKILNIIATSMLAVTTFSLSTMVAAYTAATNNVTPRSTQLMLEDNTTQNALSVFIGSFLYSLVGIIALSMNIYGASGRVVLFFMTIFIIAVIIIVLLRWINYLSRLGRVGQTIQMVERAATDAVTQRLKKPYMGGVPLEHFSPGEGSVPLIHSNIGYVQNIDIHSLSEIAEAQDIEIYLRAAPGSFNDGHKPCLYLSKPLDDRQLGKLRESFSIDKSRSFDQDPRFGLIVLSEIASRALSPALNDPGTAIQVIGTAVRVLEPWVTHKPGKEEVEHTRIYVPAITVADLFDDIFTAIARDGAAHIEVGIRLQKALQALAAMGNEDTRNQAKRHAALALERAQAVLVLKEEKDRLQALAQAV